ncbi:hypothetical protein [Stratiformator vulcanicus]|uniref:hypothetical protein n=1 Tax=Stratiformator vulcanicus TaxID=2527980 RepID=UPI002877C5E7|nr:hypothetical protein [Stratiformator vulcanicus]
MAVEVWSMPHMKQAGENCGWPGTALSPPPESIDHTKTTREDALVDVLIAVIDG